ncbi:MAG: aldehyde ferredoxin oxidoreductase N-terminal domain-containing protein [Planctomycetota bacterium]
MNDVPSTRVLWLRVAPDGVHAAFQDDCEFPGPLAAVARLGGVGLGLALLGLAAPTAARSAPLVVAVGEAVRRGTPTAVRATLLSRAALGGRVAQGQVGGSLGPRLAGLASALVVEGGGAPPGSVLVVEAGGAARLEMLELPDDLTQRTALLARRFGTDAVLAVGRAAERGVRFASLAAGGAAPSFVGRGGLGLALARTGVSALVLVAPPVDPVADRAFAERLLASPRLAARSAAGSLELFFAAAASGDLVDGDGRALTALEGASRAHDAAALGVARHGCRGCPTPCGWTFESARGEDRPARFAATRGLGDELGITRFEDTLRLLAAADRVGVDAKELGAALALERASLGDVAALKRRIDELGSSDSPLAEGAVALARRAAGAPRALHGQVVRATTNQARLLGQCVGGGGVDPMRTFTVLSDSATLESWRAWLAPVDVPAAALDGGTGVAKGRLVAFQEELLAAVDLVGFCAFTAGALLADGLSTLDELGVRLGFADGRALRSAGATYVVARRWLDEAWGADPADERPDWAARELDAPGMLAEYRACRGLALDGRTNDELLAALGTEALLDPVRPLARYADAAPAPAPRSATVHLSAIGPLAEALARDLGVELAICVTPARVAALLEHLAHLPATAAFAGRATPAVWRAGQHLTPDFDLADGDRLDLVLAISGG